MAFSTHNNIGSSHDYWVFLSWRKRRSVRVRRKRAVYRKPSIDFSLTGLVYCSMMMFMGLAAVNTQANLLFGVFGLMIGVLLVSMAVCRLVLMKLRVNRILPDHATVGQPVTIQYQFHNAKRIWPSLSVTLAELEGAQAFVRQPHAYMLHAAPGMTATVPAEVVPERRGLYLLGSYQLSTSFPFGFIKRAFNRRKDDTILIFPAMGAVSPALISMCRSADRTGANRKPRRGGADEFYGVKEFRDGENPRWIHWKRSAHSGHLVMREMAQISPPRLVILLDTQVQSNDLDEQTGVEKSIARAASLARSAMDSGMAVGLCVWSGHWTVIEPLRGKQHIREILAILAKLPANKKATLSQLLDRSASLARNEATMVLFTSQAVQLGLAERTRGSMVIVSSQNSDAEAWFKFDPSIDFSKSIPDGQVDPAEESEVLAAG
jgi:uncharacterized protein (DUF58 family)